MMHNNDTYITDIQKALSKPPKGTSPFGSNCAGGVLHRLGIPCHPYPCRSGEFYFCTVPTDSSITFNLKFTANRTIRLWRFIGTAPPAEAGSRWEYRKPDGPQAVIGLEVTAEGDICLFAEQELEAQGTQCQARIIRMLLGYIRLISSLPDKLISI